MGLTISKAAKAAGVNVETIRFYERQGLIERPAEPERGYRQYEDDVVIRIRSIKRAQSLGFTLAEIQSLLSLSAGDCDDVRTRAERKLASVREKIRDLQRVESALNEVIVSCRGRRTPAPCPVLDALEREPATRGATEQAASRQRRR